MGLYEKLQSVATGQPQAPALLTLEAAVTYGTLLTTIDRVSGGLLRAGVRAFDRVAILSGSRPEMVVAYYACFRIGAVVVPISPKLSASEVVELIGHSGATYCIAEAQVWASCANRLEEDCGLKRVWLLEESERCGRETVQSWTHLTEADAITHEAPGSEALAAIFYTSGTTGRPKGIAYTQLSLASGAILAGHQGAGRGPGTLALFDLIHAWAIVALLATLERAQSFVLSRSFAPEAVLNLLRTRACDWVAGIPSSYRSLTELASHQPALVPPCDATMFVVGGDTCPMDVKRRFTQVFGNRLLNSYGSIELGGPVMLQPNRDFEDPLIIGAALAQIDFYIKEPIDGIGELVIRSPARPAGVWDGAGVDRSACSDWVTTGDLVRQDEEGLLHFVARAKDIMKVNGVAVAPQEVERALASHPSVAAALVFGAGDAEMGEVPIALIKLRPGASADASDLRQYLAPHLAQYKIPREIRIVDELPLTSAGKVGRQRLAAAHAGQQVEP